MANRYYAGADLAACSPGTPPPQIVIQGAEANHIAGVMRQRVGDVIMLFDGYGNEARAEIVATDRSAIQLRIQEVFQIDRETPIPIHVATCLPKGDRQKFLVEKLTEIGVATWYPLVTARSVVVPKPSTIDKFHRWIIESSKQCLRNVLMRVEQPLRFDDFLSATHQAGVKFLFDPSGDSAARLQESRPEPTTVTLAIGPEGGFTAEELAAAEGHDWSIVSLGPRIMRIETAALCAASWALTRFAMDK